MTTRTATRSDPASTGTSPANGSPVAVRRRGRSRLVLIGSLLAVLGAVAGVVVVQQTGQRESVIALARPVPFGHQVTEQDLRQILLSADAGLATVDWTESDEIVGRIATTDLLPGQIMTRDAVTTERLPGPGQAIVGVAVKRGQLPVTPLAPRDQVLIVDAAETSGAGVDASVLRVGDIDVGGERTVDLLIVDTNAPLVARMSEAGRAVLVLVARR